MQRDDGAHLRSCPQAPPTRRTRRWQYRGPHKLVSTPPLVGTCLTSRHAHFAQCVYAAASQAKSRQTFTTYKHGVRTHPKYKPRSPNKRRKRAQMAQSAQMAAAEASPLSLDNEASERSESAVQSLLGLHASAGLPPPMSATSAAAAASSASPLLIEQQRQQKQEHEQQDLRDSDSKADAA